MNNKNLTPNRPYICPGCDFELPIERESLLAHMEHCAALQTQITIGRVRNLAKQHDNALKGWPADRPAQINPVIYERSEID